jgi:hypothetical protein
MADYPSTTFTPTTKNTGDTIAASHVNALQAEVTAVEAALLTSGLAHHLLFVDATYDIGASGATRPRDLYLSRNALIGGTLEIQGLATVQAGLAFPAIQAVSGDPNTLDDYEEGAWTPTITSSGGGAPTYTQQVGGYVKVGKYVCVSCRVVLASKGTLGAGNVSIAGLPFSTMSTTNLTHSFAIGYWFGLTTSVVALSAYADPSATAIQMHKATAATTGVATLTVADLSGTDYVFISGTYIANA